MENSPKNLKKFFKFWGKRIIFEENML